MDGFQSPASAFARPGMPAQPALMDPPDRGNARPEPESRRALRRRFTAAYKLDFLRRAEAAVAAGKGKLGRLLRREGLRSSTLSLWRKQMENGTLKGSRRGRPPKDRNHLMKENDRLRRKLAYFEECLEEAEELAWPGGKHGQPAQALKGMAVKKRILDLADLALRGRPERPEATALPGRGAPAAPGNGGSPKPPPPRNPQQTNVSAIRKKIEASTSQGSTGYGSTSHGSTSHGSTSQGSTSYGSTSQGPAHRR